MNAGFSLADFQHLSNEKTGFIFPHSLIYLSTVLESVDQKELGLVEILSDTNFLLGANVKDIRYKMRLQRNLEVSINIWKDFNLNTRH